MAAIDPEGTGAHVDMKAAAAAIGPGAVETVCGKRTAREDALIGLDVQERKLRLLQDFGAAMSMCDKDWKSDSRLVLQTTDYLKNVMFGGSSGVSKLASDEPADAQLAASGGPAETEPIITGNVV